MSFLPLLPAAARQTSGVRPECQRRCVLAAWLGGLALAAVLPARSHSAPAPPPAPASFALSEPPAPGDFPLVEPGGRAALICVPPGEDKAVRRAAEDLAADIERVTGARPAIVSAAGSDQNNVVMIRTAPPGAGSEAESWTAATGFHDEARDPNATHATGATPAPRHQLDLTGSSRRGTIYGIYSLSEAIGVSPWYWWADVPVKKRASLYLKAGEVRQPAPAVKFRGIFLNDEDWGLRPWAARTLEPETGNIGPKTYARVFELLLRLKANTLWPAMHPGTRAFNAYPEDAALADDYGIVMGSSHCEQMLRDNIDEWKPATDGDYNYFTNKAGVLRYWEERVQSNAKFESLWTLGMRGIHDSGMPGGRSPQEKAAKLLEIVHDQRGLLGRYVNPDPARVPQIFCPYKEVLALYRLAPDYPADITLVWPDDNFGYVRQFSNEQEQKRPGGAGVYYHISYWGGPHDYLWLDTTPPALMWEELAKAYDFGAGRVWIVNVGDLKPGELGLEYFLRLAWDPHAVSPDNPDALLAAAVARDFGPENADEIVAILRGYYQFNWDRKPEFLEAAAGQEVYSPMRRGHDEISERLDLGRRLAARADALEAKLPADQRAAYYQLVLYPVRCSVAMNGKWLNLIRYKAYTGQGRASAQWTLDEAHQADDAIHRETAYYNDTLSGGKWRGMMSDHPRDLPVFGFPKLPPAPPLPEGGLLCVSLDAKQPVLRADGETRGRLWQFCREIDKQAFPIEVFNGGRGSLRWTAAADAPWLHLSRTAGEGDARVMASVDWTQVPDSGASGTVAHAVVRFRGGAGTGGQRGELSVGVEAIGGGPGESGASDLPAEDNGRVVIDPRAGQALGGGPAWKPVQGLGAGGHAVAVVPAVFAVHDDPAAIQGGSPCLRCRFTIRTPGIWSAEVRALPTWPVAAGRPQRYAISVDDQPPVIRSLPLYGEENDPRWQQDVMRNASLTFGAMMLNQPGLHVLNVWAVDPGLVIDGIELHRGTLD